MGLRSVSLVTLLLLLVVSGEVRDAVGLSHHRALKAGTAKVCPLFCKADSRVSCGGKVRDGGCYNCCNLPAGCKFINADGTTSSCS